MEFIIMQAKALALRNFLVELLETQQTLSTSLAKYENAIAGVGNEIMQLQQDILLNKHNPSSVQRCEDKLIIASIKLASLHVKRDKLIKKLHNSNDIQTCATNKLLL